MALSDGDKLRGLATWFDQCQDGKDPRKLFDRIQLRTSRDIQTDLRRMADNMDEADIRVATGPLV